MPFLRFFRRAAGLLNTQAGKQKLPPAGSPPCGRYPWPSQKRLLSFGANAVLCKYALCGVVEVEQTEAELVRLRNLGVPKDRWESQKLHFVPFTPEEVARFMAKNKPWSPLAVVCAVHALLDRYGAQRLEKAFRDAKIELNQHLPES